MTGYLKTMTLNLIITFFYFIIMTLNLIIVTFYPIIMSLKVKIMTLTFIIVTSCCAFIISFMSEMNFHRFASTLVENKQLASDFSIFLWLCELSLFQVEVWDLEVLRANNSSWPVDVSEIKDGLIIVKGHTQVSGFYISQEVTAQNQSIYRR